MARNLIELLDQLDLIKKKIVAYIKDEGANFNAMTTTLKFVVIVKFLVWKKVSKALVLVMHFLKHVNMGQQKKLFVKA
jgi:hypothetical protein